jgi:hypothetical protein
VFFDLENTVWDAFLVVSGHVVAKMLISAGSGEGKAIEL